MSNIVRFDCFEVDLSAGTLRKRDKRIRLPEQPFRVLASLLEHPGQVATREDLRYRLWPDDVFVDFDNSLNIAVARLRTALGESAGRPRFIETLPKRGYRFIGKLSSSTSGKEDMPISRPRLAVLPFLNLTGDKAQEYFSDAITDEVITALAALALEQLSVIARTTAMRYKGNDKDVVRIGHELDLDYIVEGALHRTDERIVVTANLIRIKGQEEMFARRYDLPRRSIFQIYGSIAQDIAAHVPSIGERFSLTRISKKPTGNFSAYNEYIKGRHEMWKWTPEGVEKAKQHFEAALALDPRFALACVGIAVLYGSLGFWGFLPPDETEPLRRFYGLRALELDPALAEARMLVAYRPQKCHYGDAYSYNWLEAEREMAHARDSSPNSPTIRFAHAAVLLTLGKHEEALEEVECALESDPLSLEVRFWLVMSLFLGRKYERGLMQAREFVDLEPGHHIGYFMLGLVYLGMERFEESVAALRRAAELSNNLPFMLGWLGLALGMGGHTAEARMVLERLHEVARHKFVLPTSFAWLYLGLGEIDRAFSWMDQAVFRNDEWVHPAKSWPFLDPLRSDARFSALLLKINVEL